MANTATTKSKTNPAEDMTPVIEHRLESVKKEFPELITIVTGQNNPRKELYETLIDGIIIKDILFINKIRT